MWRFVYCCLTYLLLPGVFGYFAWRGRREPAYRDHWGERLGYISARDPDTLWVHAASVGEVVLVTPLIEALLARYPDHRVLLTTLTPTGREEARRRLGDCIDQCYLPLDTAGATRRFIRRARPAIGLLAETELWPNLVAAADRAGIPLVLVNASVSARSAARYQRWPLSCATRFMLRRFAGIAAAGPAHAERFIAAGALPSAVNTTGNLKYDRRTDHNAAAAALRLRRRWLASARPIWLAASTHDNEELQLLDSFATLRQRYPTLLWIIAPRHPQRFDAVAGLLEQSGWRYARRSSGEAVDDDVDIVLADTLGELDLFYALADVAFVGGSLTRGIGGHNVIEPATAGCVFTTGPDIAEWRDAIEPMIEAGGAVVAEDSASLAAATDRWLADERQRRAAGERLVAVAAAHRGALERTLRIVAGVMDAPR